MQKTLAEPLPDLGRIPSAAAEVPRPDAPLQEWPVLGNLNERLQAWEENRQGALVLLSMCSQPRREKTKQQILQLSRLRQKPLPQGINNSGIEAPGYEKVRIASAKPDFAQLWQ